MQIDQFNLAMNILPHYFHCAVCLQVLTLHQLLWLIFQACDP